MKASIVTQSAGNTGNLWNSGHTGHTGIESAMLTSPCEEKGNGKKVQRLSGSGVDGVHSRACGCVFTGECRIKNECKREVGTILDAVCGYSKKQHNPRKGNKMKTGNGERLLTAKEAADRLGVKAATVYRWGQLGMIDRVKLSARCVRYPLSSILKAKTIPATESA